MRPSHAILVVEMLRNSFTAPLYRKGVELSLNDSLTTMEVYQQWILLLLDLDYLSPDALKRDAQRLWIDIIHADVFDLNNAFAECLHLVRVQTSKGFKGLCKRISTHLYSLIKDDIRAMQVGDVFAAKRLTQVFSYTTRLTLHDIDLTQQLLEEYVNNESLITNQYPQFLVHRLNMVMRRWLAPFDPAGLRSRHGKGGIAGHGRTSIEVKYKDLTTDQMLQYAYGDPEWIVGPIRSTLDRISQTIFVPKSYKTFRTISMEPTTLMYFQQGVWHEIDRLVSENLYLRNHIGFHEQDRNKRLACKGSIDRDYATIDLSSASDSVSYELVKAVFRGTKLLRYIVATRSRRTLLPDGRILTLKKFAPMGSALCFPIETLLFAAICELVTQESRVAGRYSVYGDDIIVPTKCVGRAFDVLQMLGFRINREKSFHQTTCWFRESCGGEYVDGYDITPVRVSRKYNARDNGVRIDGLIDMANQAYEKGFRNLRIFFLKKLRDLKFKCLFSPTAILADNYTNYHTKKRWNRHLQRIEVFVSQEKTHYDSADINSQDESIRYRHWLESTYERNALCPELFPDADRSFQSVICRPTRSFSGSWMCKPYELQDQEFIDYYLSKSHNSRLCTQEGGGLVTP